MSDTSRSKPPSEPPSKSQSIRQSKPRATSNAKAGVPRRQIPTWGWIAFLLFSFLSALSAFKFVFPGLIYGVFVDGGSWARFVVEGITRGADHVAYHIENVGSVLAVHMVAGGLAVLLSPLQVSRMWRRGDRRKHVYLGWALVPIVTIGALTTPVISFNMHYPLWSELGFAMGSVAWFGALVMGIWAIKTKQYVRHQRWMVMMVALSFGAVSFRLQLPILRLFWDMHVVFPYLGWTCWVPNVLVVAWWWYRQARKDTLAAQPAQ